MPMKMGGQVQSVVIGDTVYVGGGNEAKYEPNMCIVMKLDLQQEQWTTLPQYNAWWFAMTSLNDELVLVGGYDKSTCEPTSKVSVLEK